MEEGKVRNAGGTEHESVSSECETEDGNHESTEAEKGELNKRYWPQDRN
jgi:hypothetical protein